MIEATYYCSFFLILLDWSKIDYLTNHNKSNHFMKNWRNSRYFWSYFCTFNLKIFHQHQWENSHKPSWGPPLLPSLISSSSRPPTSMAKNSSLPQPLLATDCGLPPPKFTTVTSPPLKLKTTCKKVKSDKSRSVQKIKTPSWSFAIKATCMPLKVNAAISVSTWPKGSWLVIKLSVLFTMPVSRLPLDRKNKDQYSVDWRLSRLKETTERSLSDSQRTDGMHSQPENMKSSNSTRTKITSLSEVVLQLWQQLIHWDKMVTMVWLLSFPNKHVIFFVIPRPSIRQNFVEQG